jgi:hypothetical protein
MVLIAHADGRYTQTKKASIVSNQLLVHRCQVEEISMNELTQFQVCHTSRLSIDNQYLRYIGMGQALKQGTVADHSRRPGYDWPDRHALPRAPTTGHPSLNHDAA